MAMEDIIYIKSFDFESILTKESRFTKDGEYMPFVLEGLYVDTEEANELLASIDPDLYVAGSFGGLEISRRSFWM